MIVDIENGAQSKDINVLSYLALCLSKNLKEMRDRLMKGDESVIEEFFKIHVFDDDIEFVRPLKASEESTKFINALAHELKTQDNSDTAEPVYLVMEKQRLYGVAPEFYEDASLAIYRDEIMLHEGEEGYEQAVNDMTLDGDGYQIHWISQNIPVAFFLTRKAAQEYIDTQSHRHRHELYVWVDTAIRNPEIKPLRKMILNFGNCAA